MSITSLIFCICSAYWNNILVSNLISGYFSEVCIAIVECKLQILPFVGITNLILRPVFWFVSNKCKISLYACYPTTFKCHKNM